jgi:hypothetical protein
MKEAQARRRLHVRLRSSARAVWPACALHVVAFPFSSAANPFSYGANHFSQVNVLSPDLTRFPAWADADRALLELGPGDMLFIPVYSWHAVWGIEQNMSINYWWRARRANRLQHPRQMAAWTAKRFLWLYTLRARDLVRRSTG